MEVVRFGAERISIVRNNLPRIIFPELLRGESHDRTAETATGQAGSMD